MADYDKLHGFAAQSMGGPKVARLPTYSFSPAVSNGVAGAGPVSQTVTGTWGVPASGLWRIVLWGAGGSGSSGAARGGGSGAFILAERYLLAGQSVSWQRGGCAAGPADGGDSYVTLPSGEQLRAGGGKGVASGAGGVVTGGNPA